MIKVSVLREPGVCPRPPGLVPGEADPVGAPLPLRMGAGPVPGVGHRGTNTIAGEFIWAHGFVGDVIGLNWKLLWG